MVEVSVFEESVKVHELMATVTVRRRGLPTFPTSSVHV